MAVATRSENTVLARGVQYVRPNGRQVPFTFPIPKTLHPSYDELTKRGCRIVAELLPGNQVYVAIEHNQGDVTNRIVPDGAQMWDAIEDMLARWEVGAFYDWLDRLEAGQDV